MKEIQLFSGEVVFVSDCDFGFLSQWGWYAVHMKNLCYAVRKEKGKTSPIYMHRVILNPPSGIEIDHRDGNGLNNRRGNLRMCTHQQNHANRRPNIGSTSKFKGVCWSTREQRWKAQLKTNGKNINIGCYDSETDAAIAYDKKAIEVFGNFAYLNFNQ